MHRTLSVNHRTVLKLIGIAAALSVLPITANIVNAADSPKVKIGIIGSGHVGSALGGVWAEAGNQVMFSSRNPENDKKLAAEVGADARAGTPQEAAAGSAAKPYPAPGNQTTPSTAPTATLAPKSLLQLHAAFRESQRCMEERIMLRAKSYNPDGLTPPHIPGCDDMKGALRKVYEATTAAAKAGDLDAQMCFLMQGAGDRESGRILSDAEIAEYQSVAPKYVQAAFERGDWRIVELLGYHVVDWAGLFINLEQWKDPLREYKAHQLLLLGAADVESQNSSDWRAFLRMPQSKDNWRLSTQEMHESDAWAQETYDKYFIRQPKLLKEPKVCTGQDEAS